jgi:hypothetical protein
MAFMSKVKNRVSSGDSREIIANIVTYDVDIEVLEGPF